VRNNVSPFHSITPPSLAYISLEQEKHEEDRYIREQEKKYFEKKKAELEKKLHEEDLTHFKEAIAPKMAEVSSLLKKTGDNVSDEGLEALARWKVGK
jgi:hypothetical protein